MDAILVSRCLLGENVKYNGKNNYTEKVEALKEKYIIIPICPEVLGGLTTPRIPSEIKGDKVIASNGEDVTLAFTDGATLALAAGLTHNVKFAVLKDGSPSCGVNYIYDGTFSHARIDGEGVTTRLLKENGIKIYSEADIDKLL